MPEIPPGVTSCTITYGKALGFRTDVQAQAAVDLTLTADRSLTHVATGWTFHSAAEKITVGPGRELSFTVPHVDQDGFNDSSGHPITMWSYRVTGTVRFIGGATQTIDKVLQPLVGTDTLDLADIPDGPPTPAVTSPSLELQEAQQARDDAIAARVSAEAAAGVWQPATSYTAGAVAQAPDGSRIKRNTSGTSRASFDATEQALWTPVATTSGTVEQKALAAGFVGQDAIVFDAKNHYGAKGDFAADDTAAIQAAIDAAFAAGGGTVLLPAGRYIVTQIVIKEGVHLTGPGRSYGGSTAPFPATIFQKAGSTVDMVIPDGDSAGYCKPFGFSYVTLVSTASSSGGCGFATRKTDGSPLKWQDNCFMHHIQTRGFASDGVFIGGGSAVMNISDIAGLWNGGYGVHVKGATTTGNELQACFLVNISGDGNLGGAALCIENMGVDYSLAITNLKSEQRVNSIRDPSGPPAQPNALRLINCGAFVTIDGLQHISSSANTVKPGDAIRLSGSPLPVVTWTAVKVRDTYAGQTGATPVLLNDTVQGKTVPLNVITGVYGTTTDVRFLDFASTSRYWFGRAGDHTKPAPANPEFSLNGDTPLFVLNRDGEPTDQKLWGMGAHSGGAWELRMYGDDGSTGDRPIRVGRTGKTSTTMGFFGVTPVARPSAYTQTYSTADKTLGAYTANAQGTAYTGTPADAASTAKLADLNALRVAYENLRAFTEDLAQQHNSLITDLKNLGLIQ